MNDVTLDSGLMNKLVGATAFDTREEKKHKADNIIYIEQNSYQSQTKLRIKKKTCESTPINTITKKLSCESIRSR